MNFDTWLLSICQPSNNNSGTGKMENRWFIFHFTSSRSQLCFSVSISCSKPNFTKKKIWTFHSFQESLLGKKVIFSLILWSEAIIVKGNFISISNFCILVRIEKKILIVKKLKNNYHSAKFFWWLQHIIPHTNTYGPDNG